jgi:hypothetical protein
MNLELKHLAPYLPYGLKAIYNEENEENTVVTISGTCILDKERHYQIKFKDGIVCLFIANDIKPILKPVLDFEEMIIRDIKLFLEISHNQTMEFLGFMDGQIKLQNISLGLHEAMCKKHIDFNKLIEKGLAIDINTLK